MKVIRSLGGVSSGSSHRTQSLVVLSRANWRWLEKLFSSGRLKYLTVLDLPLAKDFEICFVLSVDWSSTMMTSLMFEHWFNQ